MAAGIAAGNWNLSFYFRSITMIRIAKIAIAGLALTATAAYAAAPATVSAACSAACMSVCMALGVDCGMTNC